MAARGVEGAGRGSGVRLLRLVDGCQRGKCGLQSANQGAYRRGRVVQGAHLEYRNHFCCHFAAGLAGESGVYGLAAGGISALLLYYAYTQNASTAAGFCIVTRARFICSSPGSHGFLVSGGSGRSFQQVLCLVSLVMVAGYFHGILHSSHA